ncbi:probable inactive 1-aminocyclopropane-1-carboxylate synthase-like protein 2 [Penaeus japonicus]|uniref:probable inactive 1-aminocyclopropane-1-carboxylate synthase-like protein 2 n=1 Tax=Penaeus japonicus TaxID=27405 RepID=UPI001C70FD5D|nr:probable inactive 1-aminocyclopropane-1-carboxylate synthase-like protein 2 [Penaeus japonicus]
MPFVQHKQCNPLKSLDQTTDKLQISKHPPCRGDAPVRTFNISFGNVKTVTPTPIPLFLIRTHTHLDSLDHALCDPGDVLLTPTPVYGRIFTDFCDRSLVCVEPIDTSQETNGDSTTTFGLRPEVIEERIVQLTSEGRRVRGLVLIQPHNPLGNSFSPEVLREIFAVCARHQMHVIVDEIYALSVFDSSAPHHSVLSLKDLPDPERTHVLWGLSKDFSLAGFRVGVIHTQSEELLQCLRAASVYHLFELIVREERLIESEVI